MSLSSNQAALISQLEGAELLNERYEKLNCVNIDGGNRRGMLSLVFQAHDTFQKSLVAIKVMDPARLSETYRLEAFEREPSILESLVGRNRCLQLIEGMQYYSWQVDEPNMDDPLEFKCGFFTTEWIEEDVDDYFYRQQDYSATDKLQIFRLLLLAIEAIHRENIFHRDIKVDNIRVKFVDNRVVVILIDFGTAAKSLSKSIDNNYAYPVGASGFSPPEAFVGLSGDRKLGKLSDSYAAGAMLYNLFNCEPFYFTRENETQFSKLIMSLAPIMVAAKSRERKLREWKKHIYTIRNLAVSPRIDAPGNSIPLSILEIVKKVYAQLTYFDFFQRTSNLSEARFKIEAAIRTLSNQRKELVEMQRKKDRRLQKREKLRRKQERLEIHFSNRRLENA